MARELLLFLLGASTVCAAEDCASLESIWKLQAAADPQPQPHGKNVVYVQSWNDVQEDRPYSNLHVVAIGGGAGRSLTQGKYRDSSPRWSPDGKRIAYVSDRSGKSRIHVRDFQTGEETTITDGERVPSNLSWSPNGEWIAFTAFTPVATQWMPARPSKPAGANWAPPAAATSTLRWTFDGTGVLEPGGVRIFAVPAGGGIPRQISREPYHHTFYVSEPELTWSSDGRSILAPAVKAPDGWAVYNGNQIYVFPLSGGEPRPLTHDQGHKAQVRVSPDGARVAFTGYQWKGQSYHVSKLHVMNSDGGNARVVTPALDRDVTALNWSTDSRKIYFLSEDRGSTNLYVSDLEGGVTQLSSGAQRLSSPVLALRDTAVALQSSPVQPPVLVVLDLTTGKTGKVAEPNADLGCRFPPAEEIWFNSFDGARIQGWIIKPRDFDPGRKYPLLVSMHGGPHAAYGASFNHELQMFAAHGYVTLYTNPRGSTGYGEAFGNSIQHKWPGDDIKDVLSGVDFVTKSSYVDAKRMVVTGGSGGGLMTAWIIGQTDRFRAAVAWYPVTNWFTHVGSGDNGFYIASVYRKGMPWDEPDDYIRHSPLFYAKDVKTPTMIITGEEDWRTPIAQSQEFFRALKVRGIDAMLVRVPGESHGIQKRPSHKLELMTYTLEWLNRYIQ